MVEGVRYLIIKCSNLNNPPPLQISLQMRAILSSLYSWCRIWDEVAIVSKHNFIVPASRHLICMHWLQIKLQRSILPKATIHGTQPTPARIYCQIYVATHILPNIAASRLKAGAPSSWNILPFSNSYLFSNCKIHLCHHSFCASLPSTSSCFAICRFILSNYFDVKFASFSYHFH